MRGISEQARRSRERQGLPPGIEDPATLARVAEMFRVAEAAVRARSRGTGR